MEEYVSQIDDRAMRILEFEKVRAQMVAFAATSLGKERIQSLRPLERRTAAEEELAAVDECLQVLYRSGALPFGGITDVRPALRKAAIGGVLTGLELAAIANFIYGGRRVRQAILAMEESVALPHLQAAAAQLADARHIEAEIRRNIDDEGQVLDTASPELRRIRSQKRQAESRVRQVLENMLRTHQRYLQDPVIALRGSHLCLPVRVEFKNMVPGIVHDYSASGQTVFIEPQAAVEAGQRVRELELEEEREVERVLQRVSSVVAAAADELLANARILADLDAWQAKAAYAKANGCTRPQLDPAGVWRLRQARHPLLPRETVVPIDLALGAPSRLIIITGPNTGGKTVTLKTVGLLTLLAMSGCFIPAAEDSSVGWCDRLFVDIGDEQSIEQSLSTFSSHMRNIVEMLHAVSPRSLVLLDELGAGTDPTEGAALAMAILDDLNQTGCRVVATTHYAELKGWAFNEPNAVNASVEFDVETLRPTYRLLVGVPGRSNAIAIAKRLGLPERIIGKARSLLSTDDVRVEDLIARMERARQEMEAARDEAVRQQAEAERLREALEAERARLADDVERTRARAAEQAREIVQRAQSEANRIIQELREMRAAAGVKDHELVALRKSLEEALPRETSRTPRRRKPDEAEPGDVVKVLSLGQKGEVVEKSPDGKQLFVQLGALRMKVSAEDVELVQRKPAGSSDTAAVRRGLPKTIPLELDIRGETVDSALPIIDKYLDDAVLSGLHRVAIVHGKGTGALRDGVRKHLARHPQVASWSPGGPGEGGDGVTIVELQH